MTHRANVAALISLLALSASMAQAQGASGGSRGSVMVGHLGITDIECDCTFDGRNPNARSFRFRSNPVILGVDDDGPSDGLLFRGDTIFDIDSRSLRSRDGALRFANIRPGQTVTLGIHRDRRTIHVAITASAISADDPSGLGQYSPRAAFSYDRAYGLPPTPRSPRRPGAALPPSGARGIGGTPPPRASTPPLAPGEPGVPPAPRSVGVPPTVPTSPASPRGWFGFSIRCNDCGWSRNGNEPYPRWESTTYPEITLIAPGSPADKAGFRTGDLITQVDGLSILQPDGARRFGMLQPGQHVRLTVSRKGQSITRDLILGDRHGIASRRNTLRYTGKVSNVDVEVWSPQAATVQRDGDTITISVGATTVRVKTAR